MRIAEHLDLPLRERNDWLLAAGYAPRYPETPLTAPALSRVRASLQVLLDTHDPFFGVAIDRQWNVQLSNHAGRRLVSGIPEHVRGVPTNLFRTALHPGGLASRTRNFAQWSAYLLRRLDRAVVRTQDPHLAALADDTATWPAIPERHTWSHLASDEADDPVLSWRLELGGEELSMFSILSTFATPMDVTLSDLSIELFFPADERTGTPAPAGLRDGRPTERRGEVGGDRPLGAGPGEEPAKVASIGAEGGVGLGPAEPVECGRGQDERLRVCEAVRVTHADLNLIHEKEPDGGERVERGRTAAGASG
ncbi:MmyB family transcriptional regulator [Micromonospora sp. NPDC005113]